MNEFQQLLIQIAQRPAVFVGTTSLTAVSHYLNGYAHAAGDREIWNGWRQWIELRFNICHPAWHWTRILLHVYGSDATALAALPELYAEFVRECEQDGLASIMEKWEDRFGSINSITEPTSTATTSEL